MNDNARMKENIRKLILDKVGKRGKEKSICPSEVARDLGGSEWRELMQLVREVGIELMDAGLIVVMQKGLVIDPRTAKGPIRYRIVS
mmetsp:Transcript_3368/g.5905  ORF Transcript_3368/g.5905 Transcript_3368/m.5905 type:complete len:87 (+) Transcript_3368:1072-1332(+)